MSELDLDVDAPELVAQTLREAAERYRDSAAGLCAAWQDDDAGRVWGELARVLERAADACDRAVMRHT